MISEAYLGMHYKGLRFPDFYSAECWGSCSRSKAARNISLVLVRRFHEKWVYISGAQVFVQDAGIMDRESGWVMECGLSYQADREVSHSLPLASP